MTGVGIINGLAYMVVILLFVAFLFNSLLPLFLGEASIPEMGALFGEFTIFAAVFNGIIVALMAPISLILVSGILFALARGFGGRGEFQEQTYLIATFYAPLHLLSGTVGLIPVLGNLLTLGLFVYQVVLSRYAVQACHEELSPRQAWSVVLIPVGVLIGLFSLLFILWFLLLFGPLYWSGR